MKKINQWTTFHSVLILLATLAAFYLNSLLPIIFTAFMSFILLILLFNKIKVNQMVFGLANLITILRLLIVLFIGTFYILLENYLISLMALIVLAGDGLDGKIARSRKETSELGEYLDKETDAFFLHIMIMSAVFKDILWEGTVIIGILRYLFVLTIFILGDLSKKERRSRSGRYIYVFAVVSLILSFLPLPGIYIPAIFLATGLLLYSFGRDFIWLFSTR